jgi:hypothetical protein
MKKIIIALLLIVATFTAKSQSGLTIKKTVEFINPEPFEPSEATFKIIGDVKPTDSVVVLYFELTEKHPLYNGQTQRTGNVIVPKALIDALQLKYDGSADSTALAMLLGSFNLKLKPEGIAVQFYLPGMKVPGSTVTYLSASLFGTVTTNKNSITAY